ncbi:MAG TPA: cupin domain-containing protein [Candidatus Binataceae bacterium]|nr:cupin domain-containing protein [Candidatus Binataceae bacterium]
MISDWLPSSECLAFLERSFGRCPYARGGAAQKAVPLLGWATLDRLLSAPLHADVLTVASGRLCALTAPHSSDEVRTLLARGISTVIRKGERHDDGLRRLADAFGAVLPGEVHVQIYATPGATCSFGWHYDFEDVFIAQTLGVKDYYMRDNTVAHQTHLDEKLDFGRIRQEKSQLMVARLLAADWLYIPRRWWHLVKCEEDSLSISVGVMSPEFTKRS